MSRSTFIDIREDMIATIDEIESAFTDVDRQIEYSEDVPEHFHQDIQKPISNVHRLIREIREIAASIN